MRAILIAFALLLSSPAVALADPPPPGASCDWHRDNCRRCCDRMWGRCLPTDGNGWGTDPHGNCWRCVADCMPRELPPSCRGKGEYGNCRR